MLRTKQIGFAIESDLQTIVNVKNQVIKFPLMHE